MTLLQKLLNSQSPKLTHPFATLLGYLMQRSGWSERYIIKRQRYVLPFFASSNVALTLWACPEYEDETEKFVAGYLKPGGTFVDVGANIGCVTVCASVAVGGNGQVIALEPHPYSFECLVRTVALNGCANTSCHQVAAGDHIGLSRLTNEKRKDDSNRISAEDEDVIGVSMITLAGFLSEMDIGHIDLLKIDVEGFEPIVIAGLSGFKGQISCIYLESIEHNLRKYGHSEAGLVRSLQEMGYSCFRNGHDESNLICFADRESAKERHMELLEVHGDQ